MKTPFVVLTGGEPTIHNLQPLCAQLKKRIPFVYLAIETNGTNPHKLPILLDWITVSPKHQTSYNFKYKQGLVEADEVKIVFDKKIDPLRFESLLTSKFENGKCFIQPCSGKLREAINFVLNHPDWRLSLQTQKIIRIR